MFWSTVTDLSPRATPALGAIAIFLASLTGGVLGALLTLSGRPWYEPRPGIQAWRITPLEDQQLAGVIMWMPGGLVYLVAGVVLFAVWLSRAASPTHRPVGVTVPLEG